MSFLLLPWRGYYVSIAMSSIHRPFITKGLSIQLTLEHFALSWEIRGVVKIDLEYLIYVIIPSCHHDNKENAPSRFHHSEIMINHDINEFPCANLGDSLWLATMLTGRGIRHPIPLMSAPFWHHGMHFDVAMDNLSMSEYPRRLPTRPKRFKGQL
jgi:hypothetical protein